ncbi:MAG: hypothetical protein QGI24_06765, partial [Kiritimatiellia bacterium]|nr:hypothetical protein [Kiritimatiellia bacterium]
MKKTTYLKKRGADNGVALIIVLGLLSVLTLLAVAFAIAMRVERLAARNHVNTVKARHMIQTGLSWAIDDISESVLGATYPDWTSYEPIGIADALGSDAGGSADTCDFIEGEVLNEIPPALLSLVDALDDDDRPEWKHVTFVNSDGTLTTNGRVAYMVVNCSGCIDPHFIGGSDRVWSTNIAEIDIDSTVTDPAEFMGDREDHVRYETVAEMHRINEGLYPGDGRSMFPYSLDVGRDLFFTNVAELGYLNSSLMRKFEINSITNYAGYTSPDDYTGYSGDAAFIAEYWTPLRDLLDLAGMERPDDVAWNVVNYLDEDRIPQCGEAYPWRHTEGNEAIPLFNEIVFRLSPDAPAGSNQYEFAIELWYPFAPVSVTPSDDFSLDVAVFVTNWTVTDGAPGELSIMGAGNPDWSFSADIDSMSYGTSNEFLVFRSPEPNWISFVSNSVIGGGNAVWFLARVMKGALPVDEAMGYKQSEENNGIIHRRALKKFDSEVGYAINDPRVNGQCRYWDPTMPGAGSTAVDAGYRFDPDDNTLGTTNTVICSAWYGFKSTGTPIWAKNGLIRNIAELGHIYRSNLDDEMPMFYRFWRNIDLMHNDEGAALMDWTTARENSNEISGVIEDVGT